MQVEPPQGELPARGRALGLNQVAPAPSRRGWRWWLRRLAYAGLVVCVAGLGGMFALLNAVKVPKAATPDQTSFICLANIAPGTCGPDNDVAALSAGQNRTNLRYDQIPPVVIEAVLAAEDRDFFQHNGIDPLGILRALYEDVTNRGGAEQGGSTITQQYVKLTYLTSKRTLSRKLKEAALAVKLERKLTKQQILERYLNEVYFGRGAYGVEAAAGAYFNIGSKDLTIPQAATLAGLIRSPNTDPATQPAEALRRRNGVIDGMADMGDFSTAAADRYKKVPVSLGLLQRPSSAENVRLSPAFAAEGGGYIAEWVRQQLTKQFGEADVYTKGYRVYLTIDPTAQAEAYQAGAKVLNQPTDPSSSLVSIDENGKIVAFVGGQDFTKSQVDYALGTAGGGSGRQPGSSFKPFALAAFVQQGNSVQSVYPAPAQLVLPKADQGKDWDVTNFDNEDLGTVTVADATWQSANTVYAQIVEQVGAKAVAAMATAAGVTAPIKAVNSVVLGTSEVSPLDMASAYSTFADHGVHLAPYIVARVEGPDGKVLFQAPAPARTQAMSANVADTVTNVLRGVIQQGTGTQARIKRAAAGKTGTTTDNKDAWFVGYTCHITTAVWVGYPGGPGDPPQPMTNVHGITVNGGTFPAQIWRNYMSLITATQPPCTYRNIDAGTTKLNPTLVPGPPTTTTTTLVPAATTTTVAGTPPPAAPPAGATPPPAAVTTTVPTPKPPG